MNIFYVYQNKTKEQESNGGYLWSPQKTRSGRNNKGYTNMQKVKKGDIIFHGANRETYAISVAKEDCYEAEQPPEVKKASKQPTWGDKGYRVDSEYTFLKTPLDMKLHYKWFARHYKGENSAFDINGSGKELYLCNLDKEHAKYIINQILFLSQDTVTKSLIEAILKDILDEDFLEYHDNELDIINNIIDEVPASEAAISWKGEKQEKQFTNPTGTDKLKPRRDPQKAANALRMANYKCEYDIRHQLFLRKNGLTEYTEPHHLIPLGRHADFDYNLDVEENIVSLCSHCHNLLHYGRMEDKEPILRKLYEERKNALEKAGLKLDKFEDLKKYYD